MCHNFTCVTHLHSRKARTIIVIIPAGLLYGVAVGNRVGWWWRGQVWCYTADGHRLPVSVHRVGVERAEFRMFRYGRALKGIPVQVVTGVAGNAGSVGNGPHGDLRRYVGVDVLVEFGIEVRPLKKGVRCGSKAELVVIVRFGF